MPNFRPIFQASADGKTTCLDKSLAGNLSAGNLSAGNLSAGKAERDLLEHLF